MWIFPERETERHKPLKVEKNKKWEKSNKFLKVGNQLGEQ